MADEISPSDTVVSMPLLQCRKCVRVCKSKAGLTLHTKSCINKPVANEIIPKAFPCTERDTAYETYIGVQLHRQHAHRTMYNTEMETEATSCQGSNHLWPQHEIDTMIEAEATYQGNELNAHLSALLGRTVESVKGRRKNKEYKEKVLERKEALEAAAAISNTPAKPVPATRSRTLTTQKHHPPDPPDPPSSDDTHQNTTAPYPMSPPSPELMETLAPSDYTYAPYLNSTMENCLS